ncbi:unnamed protein product [Closterium sp. NIES-54]
MPMGDDGVSRAKSAAAVREIKVDATRDEPLLCHRLEKDNFPVVLRGAVADWPALTRWDLINSSHAREYLQHLVGSAPVQLIMTRTEPHISAVRSQQSHATQSHEAQSHASQQQPLAYFDGALRKHERIAATFSDALALACASPLAAGAEASTRGRIHGVAAAAPATGTADSGAVTPAPPATGAARYCAAGSAEGKGDGARLQGGEGKWSSGSAGAAGGAAGGAGAAGGVDGGAGAAGAAAAAVAAGSSEETGDGARPQVGEGKGTEAGGGEEEQGGGLQEMIRAMASGAAPLAFYLAQVCFF